MIRSCKPISRSSWKEALNPVSVPLSIRPVSPPIWIRPSYHVALLFLAAKLPAGFVVPRLRGQARRGEALQRRPDLTSRYLPTKNMTIMSISEQTQSPPPDPSVGLCATCIHARTVSHPRGGAPYWRCGKHDEDPTFPKYPRLPVLQCAGFRNKTSAET